MLGDKEALQPAEGQVTNLRNWLQLAVVTALAVPGPVLRTLEITGAPHPHFESIVESIIFGIAIFAAATMLVWATEVAEQLVSATLALAVLALIAVLPEYAVDLYFAWTAHANPDHAGFALANMTGANRLLVGLAWPVVFFIYWLKNKKHDLPVGKGNSVGLIFLGAATIYSFTILPRQHLGVWDGAVLISLFVVYLILSSRGQPREEAELVGPAQTIAALPLRLRWGVVVGIFAFAAGTVFASAEPFANGLVDTGESFGIDEFILVQWVAPLASEAPEFILAAILAMKGRAVAGLTVLISSKVNQWTLLVGSLPIAYAISGKTFDPLPMDSRQVEEVFLTAGQSLFAVAILLSLSLNRREAGIMFGLFAGQFFFPQPEVRWAFGVVYVALAVVWLLRERRDVPRLFATARDELSGKNARRPPNST